MIYFDPTPINFTTMLVLCLGVWAAHSASKQRADVNLPLIFYAILLIFNRMFDREMNITLILAGIALAALIRFEFLNKAMIKWISYLQIATIVLIIWNGLQLVFGPALALQI
jgi:hypothetical protein